MAICVSCTTNVHLKQWIEARGAVQRGACCGSEGQLAVDVSVFTRHIDGVIRRHYRPDDEEGEIAATLISRVAGIDAGLARLVTNVTHADEPPGQSFYDYGPLAFGGRWSQEHAGRWEKLKGVVKHEARFFGPETRTILDSILGDLDTFCGGIVIRELTQEHIVLRGRLAGSAREADEWFRTPDTSVNAPPRDKATAGRMNAAGVRVFYGALQERIAVAELRPPIGSHVVVGSFTPTRGLRVVDLGALGDVFEYEDLFSPNFDTVATRLTFLRMLEQEISLPVQPHHQALEYIPTQVVAEYVGIVLGLDGVAYRSAQVGEAPAPGQIIGPRLTPNERNVVLFRSAAVTTAEAAPDGLQAGLRFVPGSQQMFDITRIEVTYQRNMWAHYEDAAVEGEEDV